jgi:DNA segregation ATPase FtsK/SpoIIIE-like protein
MCSIIIIPLPRLPLRDCPKVELIVRKVGKASTSLIQRRLGIGYGRSARLIDMLESRGVIGPADGAKPREVIHKEAATS